MTQHKDKDSKLVDFVALSWAQEMARHFGETGAYKPCDVTRVLGDPRDCVEIKTIAGTSNFGAVLPKLMPR